MKLANNISINNNRNAYRNTLKPAKQEKQKVSLIHLFAEYVVPSKYAEKEKQTLIKFLVSKNVTATSEDQRRLKNKLKFILPYMSACQDNVNYSGIGCKTLLHYFLVHYAKQLHSCSDGRLLKDKKIVKVLVERGASIIVLDGDSNSPLGIAVAKGRIDLVRVMLQYTTTLNGKNSLGETILHIIIANYAESNDNWENYFDYIDIISNLINKGASLKTKDCIGMTPVHFAAKHCFVEILQLFKQRGANFNAVTNGGNDSLLAVCYEIANIKDPEALLKTINLLLRYGCNVKHKNHYGFNCLHYALETKHVAVVERLMKAGANPKATAKDGSTPLHSATIFGTLATVQYLLDCGVDPRQRESVCGFSSIHSAAFNRDKSILQLLVSKGLDVNDVDVSGLTPLHWASAYGNIEIVKELLKLGANVNCRDKIGRYTPLHLASVRGKLIILEDCFEFKWTHYSLMRKCLELIKKEAEFSCQVIDTLVKAGADVGAKDASGRTPLHLASLQFNHDVVEMLLKHDASLNVQDNEGLLPLHHALNSNNFDGLDCLFEYGADVNDIETPSDSFIKIMYSRNIIINHMLYYIVQLEAANLPVGHVFKTYLDDPDLRDYHTECLLEVEKLKNENLTSTLSFYDLLQRNSRRQYTFIDSLPLDLKDKFPIYYRIIRGSYQASCTRKSLLQLGKLAFDHLTTVCWPDLCTNHIFCYFSNRDLGALVDSVESSHCKRNC